MLNGDFAADRDVALASLASLLAKTLALKVFGACTVLANKRSAVAAVCREVLVLTIMNRTNFSLKQGRPRYHL
jgi:hypothetical protein